MKRWLVKKIFPLQVRVRFFFDLYSIPFGFFFFLFLVVTFEEENWGEKREDVGLKYFFLSSSNRRERGEPNRHLKKKSRLYVWYVILSLVKWNKFFLTTTIADGPF